MVLGNSFVFGQLSRESSQGFLGRQSRRIAMIMAKNALRSTHFMRIARLNTRGASFVSLFVEEEMGILRKRAKSRNVGRSSRMSMPLLWPICYPTLTPLPYGMAPFPTKCVLSSMPELWSAMWRSPRKSWGCKNHIRVQSLEIV